MLTTREDAADPPFGCGLDGGHALYCMSNLLRRYAKEDIENAAKRVLTLRKDPKDFDWPYNPKIPKREVLELAALKFNSFAGTASSLSPAS
jgi:hypothetical protein